MSQTWTSFDNRIIQHLQDGCIIVKSKGEKEGVALYPAKSAKRLGQTGYHQLVSVTKMQQYLDAKMLKQCRGYWAAAWNDQHPILTMCRPNYPRRDR
jgi:hypothetical protein